MMRWSGPRTALSRLTARWPALQQPVLPWLRGGWQAIGRRIPSPVATAWRALRRGIPWTLSAVWKTLRRLVPRRLTDWWGRFPWPDFRSIVAVWIAAISILGAYVAWRAALASTEASELDQRYLQEIIQTETREVELRAQVIQDFRILARYQEHIRLWRLLDQEARRIEPSDGRLAAALRARAQVALALARSLRPYFQAQYPDWGTETGDVAYNINTVTRRRIAGDPTLANLRWEVTQRRAELAHTRALRLTGVVALFIASLLFLTLAEFTRPRIRRMFAGTGALVMLLGLLVWVMVEPFR